MKRDGEIRIPNKMLGTALSEKKVKQLRLFACAKLEGHRAEIAGLLDHLKIHPRTGSRLIKSLVGDGWAGTDGTFIFPRAWRKLNLSKRGGLYLTNVKHLQKFESLCFAKALKKVYRKGSSRSKIGRTKQENFPTGYLSLALGLKERRFKKLKALAQRYKFIAVYPQVNILGTASQYSALKKNLPGLPIFKRGKHTVCPDVSRIKILI